MLDQQRAEWSDPNEHWRLAELGVRALCLLKWPRCFVRIAFEQFSLAQFPVSITVPVPVFR